MELNIRSSKGTLLRAMIMALVLTYAFDAKAQLPQLIGTAIDGTKSSIDKSSTAIYSFDPNGVFQALYSNDPSVNDIGHPDWGLTRVNDEFWGLSRNADTGISTLFSFNPKTNEFLSQAEFDIEAANTSMVFLNNKLWWGAGDPGFLYSYDLSTTELIQAYRFGGDEGSRPVALIDVEGTLWGVTSERPSRDAGVLFSFQPQTGLIQSHRQFSGTYDQASLTYAYGKIFGTLDGRKVRGSNELGTLVGSAGYVFSIRPDGSEFGEIRDFYHNGTSGSSTIPYGLTAYGGKLWGMLIHADHGHLMLINADDNGQYGRLDYFSDLEGVNPSSKFVFYDGKLWATSRAGGTENSGTIFSLDPETFEAQTEYRFQPTEAATPDYLGLQPVELTPPSVVNPLPDLEIAEDGQLELIDINKVFKDLETGNVDLEYTLLISNQLMLPGERLSDAGILDVSPYINRFGVNQIILEAKDLHGMTARDTMVLTVNPTPDLVKITDAETAYGSPTSSGLVVAKNVSDADEVSHFQVTGITNGVLYLNDGVTPVAEGDFVPFAEGSKGLVFDPESSGEGSFMIQPSLNATSDGLGSEQVKATIEVKKLRLVLTADNVEVNEGETIPDLTFTYEGFLEGESEADIMVPTLQTTATSSSPEGAYPITFSDGEAENYSLSKIRGFVFIKAPGDNPVDEKVVKFVGTSTYVLGGGSYKEGAGVFAMDEEGNLEVWLQTFDSTNYIGQTRWGVTAANDRIWAVTNAGGDNGFGVLFQMRFDGTGYQVLHHFDNETGEPSAGLLASNGYLWGSTKAGFGRNTGTVFRIKEDGSGFEVIHEFNSDDGWEPHGLIEAEGRLWGMTRFGGVEGDGVIFSILPNGQGFEKVFDFPVDFGRPGGELLYHEGKFWGTTKSSIFENPSSTTADDNFGSIFSILPDGTGYQRVFEFEGLNGGFEPANGRHPFGDLVLAEGLLWGMTPYGGSSSNPAGTLFSINPETNDFRLEHSFTSYTGSRSSNGFPKGDLLSYNGLLWGMTSGTPSSGSAGSVFIYNPQSGALMEKANLRDEGVLVPELNSLTKIEVNKPLIANLPDVVLSENAPEQVLDLGTYFASYVDRVVGARRYSFSSVTNQGLFGSALLTDGVFRFEPATGRSGESIITVLLSGDNGEVSRGTLRVLVEPEIDGVKISGDLKAAYRTLSDPTVFVARHELDGTEVSHFKVTGIENAEIYLADGTSRIQNNDFVSFSAAEQGLRVKPATVGEAKFSVQSASGSNDDQLGGPVAPITIAVAKADLYVTTSDTTITYGEEIPEFEMYFEGFIEGEGVEDIELPVITTSAVLGSGATSYNIEIVGGSAANYELHRIKGTLTIEPAVLNITADDLYVEYRDPTAIEFTMTYDGFVLDDDESVLTLKPYANGHSQFRSPGTYTITVLDGRADNYIINRISGTQVIGTSENPEKGAIGDKDGIKGKFVLVGSATSKGGTVFAIDKTFVSKSWTEFKSLANGQIPFSGVVEAEGKVWGTTSTGGFNGNGVIYTVTTKDRLFAKEHDFEFANGAQPNSKLLVSGNKLWGTTSQGGAHNQGIIFSIDTTGANFRNVHDFDGSDGAFPSNGLTLVDDYLWGMTTYGGSQQRGVIYRLKLDGTGYEVMHEFAANKGIPFGDLTLAEGKLWGMTRESPGPQEFFVVGSAEDNGAVFSINTDGSSYTEVHDFIREDNQDIGLRGGRHPHGSLIYHDGLLWGMTTYGGEFGGSNFGTIFYIDIRNPNPTLTKFYDFEGGEKGKYPKGGLTLFDDALWGMTTEGGENNLGVVFKLDINSYQADIYEVALSFLGEDEGGSPFLGSLEKVFVRLISTNILPMPDYEFAEGVTRNLSLDLNKYFGDQDGREADLSFTIDNITNIDFLQDISVVNDILTLYFWDNATGSTNIRIRAEGETGDFVYDDFDINIIETPDFPVVTPASTVYATLNTEGLQLRKNTVDGNAVTHFQISNIQNGRLFLNDGATELFENSFVSLVEGEKGLKFLPNSTSNGSFDVRASTLGEIGGSLSDLSTAIIEVAKAPLFIKADDKAMFYGNDVPGLTISYSGFVNDEGPGDITLPIISTIATRLSDTNNYLIELSGGSADNYEIELINGFLTINKAPLQIVADTKTISYGEDLPELTLSYSGLVNSEDISEISLPIASTTANADSEVGQYTITLDGGNSDDYDLRLQSGTLNVQKAQLVIKAENKEMTYGELIPEFSLTFDGFLDGEGIANIVLPELSTNAPDAPAVGEYGIQLAGGSAANYEITLQPGQLNVKKAPLTITANDVAMAYGAEIPELGLSYTGFVNGDEATAITVPTATTTASSTANVGSYPIALADGEADNYDLSYEPGTLTINKAALMIRPNDQHFTYGSTVPGLNASYIGFVNEDTEAVVTGLELSTTATTTAAAGIYPITAQNATADNYEISYTPGEMAINKAELLVAVLNEDIIYGADIPAFRLSYAGFLNSDGPEDITEPDVATEAVKGSSVGIYPLLLSGASAANYTIKHENGSMTINRAILTAIADDQLVVFGTEIPELTTSYQGFVNGDGVESITAPTITTTATNASGFGVYPVELTGGDAENYQIALQNGSLQIGKAVLTVSAENKEMTYGEAVPELTVIYEGFIDGEDENDIVPPFIGARVTSNTSAGQYPIEIFGGLSNNYIFQFNNAVLEVKKAPLTITAQNEEITYGDEVPEFEVAYQGFVNGQDESVITGLEIISDVDEAVSAGDYTISAQGAVASNYALSYETGAFKVNKALLTITAEDKLMGYGLEFPELTIKYEGFVGAETETDIEVPTLSTEANANSNAGVYDILLTGGASDNYEFTLNNGQLTVGRGALQVTVLDEVMTYGDNLPTFKATYQGLIGGDTEETVAQNIEFTSTAALGSSVGAYEITATAGEFSNYTLEVTQGMLTIEKALLDVTADAQQMTYGQAIPTLTRSYLGFKNGDDETDIVAPSISTNATSNSVVGDYSIQLAGGFSENYDLQLNNGLLVVGQAALIITAQSQEITYGEALPELGVGYTGFVNGQDESIVTGLKIVTASGSNPEAGTYPITVSEAQADNYEISYVNGAVTVNKAVLTITAADKSITYGEDLPALEMTLSGFKYTDTDAVVTKPQIGTNAVDGNDAGSYEITLTGGTANNYELALVNGTLNIEKAVLTVNINDQSTTYGDDLPEFTAAYSGLVNGDDETVTASLVFATTATPGSSVGTYEIAANEAAFANYNLAVNPGTLSIEKAPLEVTADAQQMTYGQAIPALSRSYDGFKDGDDETDIVEPAISTNATSNSVVGSYSIQLAGGFSENYDLQLSNGYLLVGKASLTITSQDRNMTYGDALPDFDVDYDGFVNGQNESVLTGLKIASEAGENPDAGTYDIIASEVQADNYEIGYVAGTLTVNKAVLTITATDKSITYGEGIPKLEMTFSGFKHEDTDAVVTRPQIGTNAVTGSDAGAYEILLTAGTANNYELEFINGVLSIEKAILSASINDQTMTYGDDLPDFTAVYSGLVNDDNEAITSNLIFETPATSASAVGTYAIVYSEGTLANYELNLTNGSLNIGKAPLTIKAVDKTVVYGGGAPVWTFSYGGFKNDDNETDIEPPLASANVSETSPVGNYEIGISGGQALNYEISLVEGNCEVLPKQLTIIAQDAEMVYGDELPELVPGYDGFVNGEDESILTSSPQIGTVANSGSGVGQYEITLSGADAENYTISLQSGQLTVNPAKLTVQAENLQMIYGEPVPTINLAYNTFKNDEDPSVLNSPIVVETTATSASDVGTYPISLSGGAADNYTIELVEGSVFVNKAALFAFATAQSMEFGQPVPTLGIEYRTFKNDDTEADITPPAVATEATSTSSIGVYDITLEGGEAQNYELILQNGALTIVKARQIITFSLEGQEMLPNFTFELPGSSDSGLPLIYTSSDESILSIEGNMATALNSGTVSITANQPGNENYEAAIAVTESLTIQSLIGLTEEELDIVYPNPAANFFKVKEPVQVIEIFDQQGTRVKRFEGEFDQYIISDLKRGIYTAFFYKDGKVGMSRMIIWR